MNDKDKDQEATGEKKPEDPARERQAGDKTQVPEAGLGSGGKPDAGGASAADESATDGPKEKTDKAGRRSRGRGGREKSPTAQSTEGGKDPKGSTAIERQAAAAAKPPGKRASAGPVAPPGRGGRLLLGLLVLLLAGGLVAAAVAVKRQMDERDQQFNARIDELRDQLATAERRVENLVQQQGQRSREQSEREAQLVQRLADAEERLTYQGNRLRALSTTTREDWLLAEAEYLLKLADQRMVIERSTEAAQALLEQADTILRDLEDPQLMPLRRAVAQDLTELKLAAGVDLEGLYLRLAALAQSIENLPVMTPREVPGPDRSAEPSGQEAQGDAQPWWRRIWSGFAGMFEGLDQYIRIRDHDERPAAILPPDAEQYLQQNLRLMLEKAQLAAMRAENEVYRSSLNNAMEWARRFYPESPQLDKFISELHRLAEVSVQQELPDISQSRQMLTNYIDRLHKLEGVGDTDETEAQP